MKMTTELVLELMPNSYFVIGRRELPPAPRRLELRLEDDRGRFDVRDSRRVYRDRESLRLWNSYCAAVVGWEPVSSTHIVPFVPVPIDWESPEVDPAVVATVRAELAIADSIAHSVAVELAASTEAAVFTFHSTRIVVDAHERARPAETMAELKARLAGAFAAAMTRAPAASA